MLIISYKSHDFSFQNVEYYAFTSGNSFLDYEFKWLEKDYGKIESPSSRIIFSFMLVDSLLARLDAVFGLSNL